MKSATSYQTEQLQRGFQIILLGGLVAGVLDATNGVIAYYLAFGMNPVQVLQYIASGAFGAASFKEGILMAGAGLIFHFFIAFTVAAVFYIAAKFIPRLKEYFVLSGLGYGAAVYMVMNYLVLPLSSVAPSAFSLPLFLNGVFGHALLVGLPISWFASRPPLSLKDNHEGILDSLPNIN
jgi:ABC-type transport system involved in multi-copper enzyme maturation permease subunit